MGDWKIIVPEETINLFTDPGFNRNHADSNWAVAGDGTSPTFDWIHTDCFTGIGCMEANFGSGTSYVQLRETITLTAQSYTCSAYVKRAAGGIVTATQVRIVMVGTAYNPATITPVGNGWYRIEYTRAGSASAATYGIRALEDGLLVDAAQLELKSAATTYCDGYKTGCFWMGQENNSTSRRLSNSRFGGLIKDLKDDFGFGVAEAIGTEATAEDITIETYADLPGGELTLQKKKPRSFVLTGNIVCTTGVTLATRVANLRKALDTEALAGTQPVTLIYTGSASWKYIRAFYRGGFEGQYPLESTNLQTQLKLSIQFVAPDPNWYFIGTGCANIAGSQTLTWGSNVNPTIFRYHQSEEEWDMLGHGVFDSGVYCMAKGPDNCIYVGGSFTSFNGISGADRIAKYDPATGIWSALGTGLTSGIVYDIAFGPDGTVYAGGSFTTPVAYLAKWSGSTWTSVVTGATSYVRALAFDPYFGGGILWVGGQFTNFGGVANADYICWIELSGPTVYAFSTAGANNNVYSLHFSHKFKTLFIGGAFTTMDGSTRQYVASVDSGAGGGGFSFPANVVGGSGADVNDVVWSITADDAGYVYIAGEFTACGANTYCEKVARWTGSAWEEMGDTSNFSDVKAIVPGPDGKIWFFDFDGPTLVLYYSYGRQLFCTQIQHAIGAGLWNINRYIVAESDPSIPGKYTIYFAAEAAGSVSIPGSAAIDNIGSARVYPKVVLNQQDSSSSVKIYLLWNKTTGKVATVPWEYGYTNIAGDITTIDLQPGGLGVHSTLLGNVGEIWQRGSDRSRLYLIPGINNLDYRGTSASLYCYLVWKIAYNGMSD